MVKTVDVRSLVWIPAGVITDPLSTYPPPPIPIPLPLYLPRLPHYWAFLLSLYPLLFTSLLILLYPLRTPFSLQPTSVPIYLLPYPLPTPLPSTYGLYLSTYNHTLYLPHILLPTPLPVTLYLTSYPSIYPVYLPPYWLPTPLFF